MYQEEDSTSVNTDSVSVIEAIANETQRSFEEVKRVYEDEFARLKSNARITDYLALFASRRTRAALARRQ